MERREGWTAALATQYDLQVDDGGDRWLVFQSVHGYPRREGDAIIMMAGGGGLEIAKCEGGRSPTWQEAELNGQIVD